MKKTAKTPQQARKADPGRSGTAKAKAQKATGPVDVPVAGGAELLATLVVREKSYARFKNLMICFLAFLLAVSLTWNSVQNFTRPEPKLLASTADGRIQPLPLLDEPLQNRATLVEWAKRNIPPLYDFNYANFQGQLNKNLAVMRPKTLESFQRMLNESGILDTVREDFLILQSQVSDEPVVLGEQVVQGRRIWLMEIPLDLKYDSGSVEDGRRRQITQPIVFRAWVARANPIEYDGGLMLAKFEVRARDNR